MRGCLRRECHDFVEPSQKWAAARTAVESFHSAVSAADAPGAIGPYSPAIKAGNLPADTDWDKFAKLMPSLGRGKFGGPDDIASGEGMLSWIVSGIGSLPTSSS